MEKSPDVINFILTTMILFCGVPLSYGQQGLPDQRDCLYYRVESTSGDPIRLIPSEGDCDAINGEIAKKIDVNFDGLDDLIINFGSCEHSRACTYGVYIQQPDGRYKCIFEPDHWYSDKWRILEGSATIVNGNPWMDIELYSRGNVGGRPGVVLDSYLRFDGAKYQNWLLAKGSMSSQVEASLDYNGKIYRVERLLLKAGKYGPLTLSVYERDSLDYNRVNSRNIVAPSSEGLEISEIEVIQLKGRPFFFVKGRYELFLIDLQGEKIAPFIRPGLGVEYGEDAISGTMNGFQFFDEDDYLLGIAVSYGVFCFNISDLDHPKELLRYSSDFSDHGQPYFFLEKSVDGFYNGIMSQSDTAKKSSHVSGFYTATKQARYLFRDAHLMVPEVAYADPADYEIGHPEPFLLFHEKGINGKKIPWVVDLKKGILIKDEAAKRFLDEQP